MSIGRFAAATLCVAVAGAVLPAQDPKPTDKAPPPVYVVVQVGEKYEAVAKNEVDALKKKHNDEFKKATDQYEKDKKAAEAAHQKFDKVAPKMATISIQPGEHPTKAAADAAIQKLIDAKKKEAEKPKDKPKDEPKKGG